MFSTKVFPKGQTTDYERIQDDVPLEKHGRGFKEKRSNFCSISLSTVLPVYLAVSFIVSVLGVSAYAVYHTVKKTEHGQPYACGNSSSEALALGCSMDLLTWSWLPPSCPHYTDELFRRAEPEEPWRYYERLGAKEPIAIDKLFDTVDRLGGVWTEKREHLVHCIYLLLAQAQIIRDGTRFTPFLRKYEHMEHCANMLLESVRNDTDWYTVNTFSKAFHYDQTC